MATRGYRRTSSGHARSHTDAVLEETRTTPVFGSADRAEGALRGCMLPEQVVHGTATPKMPEDDYYNGTRHSRSGS
ncbi:MAG: hypothetical protein NVSMB6_13900 [Burkholderiaceae bacterium]